MNVFPTHFSLINNNINNEAVREALHSHHVSMWFKCGSNIFLICIFNFFFLRRIDDGDWSTERSCVCTWNLDRRNLNPKQADLVIDVPTAVTALCCHPDQPAFIAGTLTSPLITLSESGRLTYTYLI